jgi:hypothetical protein
MEIVSTENGFTKIRWYTQRVGFGDLVRDFSTLLAVKFPELMKKEMIDFRVETGLPRCDYGQTVHATFRNSERDARDFPSYKDLFNGQVILGA